MSSRNWCFTLNNFTEEEYNAILEWETDYIVIGKETGEEGTPHLQGYVEWKGSKPLGRLKKLNPRIHWETRRGSREEASEYCKKENNFYENGKTTKSQGKRNDLERVKEMVKAGANTREIWDIAPSFQAMKMAEIGMKLYEQQRMWEMHVYWFWGPTGSGKTRRAFEEAQNPWISGKSLKWWDGYDGHKHVIIDDFRADFCTFHELLRILDRYPYRVETKGGTRQLVATHIWITSCHPPEKIYQKSEEDVQQLLRRITQVTYIAQKLEDRAEVKGNTIDLDFPEDNIAD